MSAREKLLHIPKIRNGIVIDHIPAGAGIRIVEIIRAYPGLDAIVITLGLNYASNKIGSKDMIKLQDHDLPAEVAEHISLVTPGVTIKRVVEYQVDKKLVLRPPREIVSLGRCRNPNCITNTERGVTTRFRAIDDRSSKFRCAFCERVFRIRELEFVLP